MSKIDIKSAAIGAAAAAVVAALAVGVATKPAGNDDALVARIAAEARLAVVQGIKDNPKLLVDTIQGYMQAEQQRQAKDRDDAAVAKKAAIAAVDGHPVIGNPEGKIELVYFFDANCVYCKRMDPALKKVVEENPDVKVIHKEIPILSETSRLAAQVSNLVWQFSPEHYANFHDRLLAHNGALTAEDIEDYLRLALPADKAETILLQARNNEDTAVVRANGRLKANLKLAEEAGITGTPFLYVLQGDGILRGAGESVYQDVTDLVVKARDAAK